MWANPVSSLGGLDTRRRGTTRASPANVISRIIPSHPSGIEYSVSEPRSEPVSKALPRRHAPLMPIRMPITAERIVEIPTSRSVGPIFSRSPVITGRPEMNE